MPKQSQGVPDGSQNEVIPQRAEGWAVTMHSQARVRQLRLWRAHGGRSAVLKGLDDGQGQSGGAVLPLCLQISLPVKEFS